MVLTAKELQEVDDRAELKVRQYFDEFLSGPFQRILTEHERGCSHGRRLTKAIWFTVGLAFASGSGLGVVLAKIFAVL